MKDIIKRSGRNGKFGIIQSKSMSILRIITGAKTDKKFVNVLCVLFKNLLPAKKYRKRAMSVQTVASKIFQNSDKGGEK